MRVICIYEGDDKVEYMQPYHVMETIPSGAIVQDASNNRIVRINEDGYILSEFPDILFPTRLFIPTESQKNIVIEDADFEVLETTLNNS